MSTTIYGRKDRKREQRRQSLVDAAKQLFLERGFEGTTIDDIVEAADVAKVTFYYHFKSKEEVALEIKRQCHEEAFVYIETMRSTNQSAAEMISVLINDIVTWTLENWRLLDVFSAQRFRPLVERELECKPEPLTLCVEVILQKGQEAGAFRTDIDKRRVAHLIDLSIMCEQLFWIRAGREPGDLTSRLEQCFDFALNGVLKRS
jgi:AcrR family transcriptional regulator